MEKSYSFAAALLLGLFTLVFTSCDKDKVDTPKPVIKLEEVGAKNSKTVKAGSDLHLEAEIAAEALIAKIEVVISSSKDGKKLVNEVFTKSKYINVKNTTFHEHIDIPETIEAGDYKLSFVVTDKLGQSTTAESDITVLAKDAGAPEIVIEEVGSKNSKTAVAGGEMHLEAAIKAVNKIAEIEVEIHNSAANYEKVYTFTGDYVGKTEVSFHEHLEIPVDAPAGEYHLHFIVKDASGKTTAVEVEGVNITSK